MTARPLSPAEAAIVARFDAAEPAPESWRGGDGLREWECPSCGATTRARMADDPAEFAALRAKAAAADRVRELAEQWANQPDLGVVAFALRRALDGPKC